MNVVARAGMITLVTASQAHGASYALHPFVIAAATSVIVTGVNDTGLTTGTYYSSAYKVGTGFVGTRRGVTTMALPGSSSSTPVPTGINNRGSVIGTYEAQVTEYYGKDPGFFVWKGGSYTAAFPAQADYLQFYPPYIGTDDRLCFSNYEGTDNFTGYCGTPAGVSRVILNFTGKVANINAHRIVAGEYVAFSGQSALSVAFTLALGKDEQPREIIPPGAASAFGAWINDAGQVAGSYKDANNLQHGFVFTNGSYTSFDMPTTPVRISITGIDEYARVVGVYSDNTQNYAFVYHAGTVTILRTFPMNYTANVAISHFGKFIAISAEKGFDPSKTQSWLATCASGSSC